MHELLYQVGGIPADEWDGKESALCVSKCSDRVLLEVITLRTLVDFIGKFTGCGCVGGHHFTNDCSIAVKVLQARVSTLALARLCAYCTKW